MNKKFFIFVTREVIKTALVTMTGVSTAAIASIVINDLMKEKLKKPAMGFVAIYNYKREKNDD